jgi:hypothetical protein
MLICGSRAARGMALLDPVVQLLRFNSQNATVSHGRTTNARMKVRGHVIMASE